MKSLAISRRCLQQIFAVLLMVVPGTLAVAQNTLTNYQLINSSATGYYVPTVVGSFSETQGSKDSVCVAVNVTSTVTTQFLPYVSIYYGGTAIYNSDFDDTGTHFCNTYWPSTGTYTVQVLNLEESSVTGTFTLQYINTGLPYTPGALGGGLLEPASQPAGSLNKWDFQYWTFPVNKSDHVTVSAGNIVGQSGSLYLALRVFDPTGAYVGVSGSNPAAFVFTPTISGYYTFVAYQQAGSPDPVNPMTYTPKVTGSSAVGLQFVPVAPCRVVDTRNPTGAFGGPVLAANTTREFDIPQSTCSIPSTAVAYSLNVTAVPNTKLGYLTMWASGQAQPTVSTLNSDGRVKANAAITPAGTNGGVNIYVTDASQVILDIDGYFVPAGTAGALSFYPLTPCRLVDTRNPSGPLGGPTMGAGSARSFPVQSGNCALPSDAAAYSLNVTAIPQKSLSYLTLWPSGQPQPSVSTLNATTGAVTANGAIVPAGSGGAISAYVSDASDVVVDVNGYYAAPTANGLSLYTTTPCRVIDTRGTAGAFKGKQSVPVETSACTTPPQAQGYVLNATVVPTTSLAYLTLWPDGENQPVVSTLNALDGAVTSNLAIVPTLNGSIDAYATDSTNLILDLSNYFAP